MKKSVLILGGAGFVGFNLLKTLAEKNIYKLSLADNFSRGKMDESLSLLVEKYNIKVIKADFTIPSSFDLLDDEYDQLYMLAAV